jgi:hypothetical protein
MIVMTQDRLFTMREMRSLFKYVLISMDVSLMMRPLTKQRHDFVWNVILILSCETTDLFVTLNGGGAYTATPLLSK